MSGSTACANCARPSGPEERICPRCGERLERSADAGATQGGAVRRLVALALRAGAGLVGVVLVCLVSRRPDLGRHWSIWPFVGASVGLIASILWRSARGETVGYGSLLFGGLAGGELVFHVAWLRNGASGLDASLTSGALLAKVLMLSGGVGLCLYALRGLPGWRRAR